MFLPTPFPKPTDILVLIEVGKKIWNFVKKIGGQPQFDEKSSTEDIASIHKALCAFQLEVLRDNAASLQEVEDAVISYVEEVMFQLDSKAEILRKYRYSRRAVDKTLQELHNSAKPFWEKEISKHLSLDNGECRRILSLPSGAKKEREMREFATTILESVAMQYIEFIRDLLKNLYENFEMDIEAIIEQLSHVTKDYKHLYDSIDNGDSLAYERCLSKAKIQGCLCTAIVKRMEE